MSLLRRPLPIWEEYVHDTRVFSSLASSFFICLSLAIIFLGISFIRSTRLKRNDSSSNTTPPSYLTYTMSDQNPPSLPHPSVDAKEIPLLPDNPLAGVYFPVTSGQLAALANTENTDTTDATDIPEGQPGNETDPSPQNVESSTSSQAREIIARGYVRYFEDRNLDEAWQRKVFIYGENKQNIT